MRLSGFSSAIALIAASFIGLSGIGHAAQPPRAAGVSAAVEAGGLVEASRTSPQSNKTQPAGKALVDQTIKGGISDRYVAKTGADTGDCSNAATPCVTIQYAVNQSIAGNTIHIASGTYDQAVTATIDGLMFVGEGTPRPSMTIGSGAANQSVLRIDGATDVSVSNIRFFVDKSFAGEGVLCTNGCTRLGVFGSLFINSRSLAQSSSYGRTNAISAGVVGSHPVPVEVTIQGNTISADGASAIPTAFRAGVALDYGFGIVGGPNPGDANDIVSVNHDVIVRQHDGGALTIQGNTFRGFGVQYTTPLVGAGSVDIVGNLFQPATPPDSPATMGDFSAMRLISNNNGIAVNVTGNTFNGHERGVLIENFPGVTLSGNTFTPKAGSSSFSHVVLSNKELFTNSPPPLPIAQSLALTANGNTFNAGTVAGMGTAIELLNDNAQGAPLGGYYGAVMFGSDGNENDFNGAFGRVFKLDNFSCTQSNVAPCPLATLYSNAIGAAANTPVVPYAGNVAASENRFDGIEPSAMSAAQRSTLLSRTQDDNGDANLGHVDYGFSGGPAIVYVDDDYVGDSYGDSHLYVHSNGAANGQTVYFGIDAFATIADAIAAVEEDGTVYVADGSYAETVAVAKRLNIVGDGSTATTTINGSLSIAASGVDAMNPLRFSGMVISNPAGDGLVLAGATSFLRFEGVAFDGNGANGVNFNGTGIDGIAFVGTGLDCRFNGNQIGVRSSTAAVAANISFDNCDFSGNSRGGIILFGASGSGNGQITDWSVNNSRFIGNDSSDTGGFGGGIWIKTGGSGSVIDGFDVTNSSFRDNGSTNALNRTGLTIRARPNTTLQNVRVCDNAFEETAALGTQSYGVLLFNDTATGGTYQPIEICGTNTFTGLVASVSGVEQFNLRGTEPEVNLTGTPLTNWENIVFGPAATTVYVDDDFAGSINGASVAFVGNPAAACAASPATFGVNAFASIGEALQHVATAGSVCVAEGLYVEGSVALETNLQVNQSVSLFGAQAGVDARNRADAGASIVVPAHANAALDYSPNATFASLLDIFADDVVVDGFVFDGDNPAITTALVIGSANPDIDGGLQIGGERINIRNNVVRNLVYSAVEAYRFPLSEPVSEGNTFHRNWIHDLDAPSNWGTGILIHYNFYAAVTENLVENVRVGFQTGNHTKPISNPAANALVANNTFVISAAGVYHNAQYTNASPFTFSDNSILANLNPAQSGVWVGFALGALNDSTTATVLGTDVNGSALSGSGRITAGFRASLISTTLASSVAINGGSISNVDYGVLATDGAFFAGAQDDVLVQNVAFSDISLAALYVEDTALAGSETTDNSPRLTVGTGNSFTNVTHQGALSGPLARIEFGPGAPLLQTVFVRSARNGHRGTSNDSNGNLRTVNTGVVNDAIADAAISGTVTLEAGTFAQNVVVNKAVSVVGPFIGVHGNDGSRGTGEAIIQPATGLAISYTAADAVVQGLTIQGSPAGGHAIRISSANADGITLTETRIVNVINGSGVESEIGSNCAVDGVDITRNLFQNISGGGASNGRGVRLGNGHCNVQILDNAFDTMTYAVFANGGGSDTLQNVTIADNLVQNTTSTAFIIAATTGTVVQRNQVSASAGGLFISDKTSNFTASCNVLSATGNGISTFDFFGGTPNVNVRIFDNAISGGSSDLSSSIAQGLNVGSNWYDGAAPAISGSAVALFAADPLPADPTNGGAFNVPACGDNTATAIVVYNSSSPQTTPVNSAFGDLSARVVDALGGAVSGASIGFVPPAAGASAILATPSGTANFNGVWTTAAAANGTAGGPYNVVASSGALSNNFVLTNGRGVSTIELVQSVFDYSNTDITLAARIVDEPGTSCGPLTPATVREVGTYSISVGACTGLNYDAPATTLTATVGPGNTVHVVETDEYFDTVAAAQAAPNTMDGHTIELAPGVYSGPILLTRPITLRGGGTFTPAIDGGLPSPVTIIDGGDVANDGITVASGIQNVTITSLEIRNFLRHCVAANNGNHGLMVQENLIHDCGGRGITVSGINAAGINNVTIDSNEVHTTGDRGIVIWDGIKRDITITNNWVHDLDLTISGGSGCCGIELQDGAATGVLITDNLVENTRDSGMAFIQLTSGSPSGRANVIARNTVRNTGRFGMEIKIPNGTGLDNGDGAIVVEDNIIDGGGVLSLRDRAGIAVHRRSFGVYPFQIDTSDGVLIRGNTVSGFRTNTVGYEGYGIVVEGFGSAVFNNTVSDNDIGLQVQEGNPSFPGDSDQNAMNDWFGRGNAQITCAAIGTNDYATGTANTIDQRSQPVAADLIQGVHNETADTWHCTIQLAIDAANDMPGDADIIRAFPGNYVEGVLINKSVSLVGPFDGTPGDAVSRNGSGEAVINPPLVTKSIGIRIGADNVTVDGVTVTGLYGNSQDVGLASGGNFGASGNSAMIRNNRFVSLQGTGIYTNGPVNLNGWTVQDNLIDGVVGPIFSGINLWKMDAAVVRDNVIRNIGYAGIQLNTNAGFGVFGNDVSNTGAAGINVGPLVSNVTVNDNLLTNVNTSGSATQAALLVYGASTDISVTCNTLNAAAGNALLAKPDGTFGTLSNSIAIFHNAATGAAVGVANSNSGQFVVGSNWYGGNAPVIGNTGGGSIVVADPLSANPIGSAACGNNAAVAVQAFAGTPQSTVVTQPFANSLRARAVDALGGAVPGASISFNVPAAGASATLNSASGTTNFNGVLSVNATANMMAGSYLVTADTAPATGSQAEFSLTNLAAALSALTIVSGDAQTGIAGLALADPLVVRAVDSFGNPVAGTPVGFVVTAGGGSIAGASAVSDANGLAGSGAWTLGRNAGANAVNASVTGNPGITPVTFTATGTEQADIAILKSSTQSQVEPGQSVDYLLSVTNIGPSNAQAVDILDALPAELNNATANWSCIPSAGSTCGAGSGMGDVSLIGSTIPVGGSISVLISANVLITTGNGVFTNTGLADLTSGTDPVSANDMSSRDIEVINAVPRPPLIFMDGFEGISAAPLAKVGSALDKLSPDWSQVRDGATPIRLFSVPDHIGNIEVELLAFRSGSQQWLRLGGRNADGSYQRSQWVAVSAGELGFDWTAEADGTHYIVRAANTAIHMRLTHSLPPQVLRHAAETKID